MLPRSPSPGAPSAGSILAAPLQKGVAASSRLAPMPQPPRALEQPPPPCLAGDKGTPTHLESTGSLRGAQFFSHSQEGEKWLVLQRQVPSPAAAPSPQKQQQQRRLPRRLDQLPQGAEREGPEGDFIVMRTPVTPNAPQLDHQLMFPSALQLEAGTPDHSPARGLGGGRAASVSAAVRCGISSPSPPQSSAAGLSSSLPSTNGDIWAAPSVPTRRSYDACCSSPSPLRPSRPFAGLGAFAQQHLRPPAPEEWAEEGEGACAAGPHNTDDQRPAEEHAADEDLAPGRPLKSLRGSRSLENIANMLDNADKALTQDMLPELTVDGTQGTYFVSSVHGARIGVFKPKDEEVCSELNPRGLHGQDSVLKSGIPKGEAWRREIAAYALDHGHFAGVPETVRVHLPNRFFKSPNPDQDFKEGSFQRYIRSDGEVWDVLPGHLPVEAVHRIAVLDIRLCNSDRHGGNVLFIRGPDGAITDLVPIDHAACAPTHLEDTEFEWLLWPQAKVPFSQTTLDYIRALDPAADAKLLQDEVGLSLPAVENVRAATLLLKEGAERGLTLRTIGELLRRPRLGEPSALEQAITDCRGSIESGGGVDWGLLEPRIRSIITDTVAAANAA
eukprot:TRINITY_DN2478_c0_g4_i1.p1 TRINITY_DN2478_c0_g4~~TRINITY_DN2478_c0_g4_i1.p1  ORF type:complete len:613 (+),score=193.70 TRINITY_DN2478_c0_g4_i1:553-2391(+)